MRSLFLIPLALALLASPQADARGGGGEGGGFHAGFVGRPGSIIRAEDIRVRRPGFRHMPTVAHRFARTRFARTAFPWWGDSWPVGDWGSGGYYGYANPPQEAQAASEPQVIVIHDDSQDRMTTAEAAPDYGYVKGCHAIPNGFHCDTATQ